MFKVFAFGFETCSKTILSLIDWSMKLCWLLTIFQSDAISSRGHTSLVFDKHVSVIGVYTYWVSLLQCQFHWMQQLCCLLRRRSVIMINFQHCNVVLCIPNSLWYGINLLYWGNRVGVGRPFFITNQSTFRGSLLISYNTSVDNSWSDLIKHGHLFNIIKPPLAIARAA